MKIKILYVIWLDHCSVSSWMDREEAIKTADMAEIHTVGWLIHEDKDKLVLALNIDSSNDNVSDAITIYKKCITERIEVVAKKTKKGKKK